MTTLLSALWLLFVCQFLVPGTRGINDTNVGVDQPLPTGYVAHPEFGVAYKVYDANVTWTEASELCVREGAQLAVIDTAQKLKYATRQPLGKGVRHVGIQWVGGKWGGEWISATKKDVLPSIPWAPNEPTPEIEGLDRAMVGWKDTNHGLISGHKSIFLGDYICELPLPGYVKETYLIPEGYVAYREIGVAYKVHARNVSWNVARKLCLFESAELAVIDSASKLDYVLHQQKSRCGRIHVGIRKVDGQWVRASNGTSLPPISFGSLGSSDHGADCGMLNNDVLEIGSCNYEPREFVCEIPLSTTVPESVRKVAVAKIPEGYVAYPEVGSAYKVYAEYVTWLEAKKRCLRDAAHLAVIDSRKKLEYVLSQNIGSAKYIHVGIHHERHTTNWVRIDNGAPVSFIPWAVGQPWGNGLDCAMVLVPGLGLMNAHCSIARGIYVCERSLTMI